MANKNRYQNKNNNLNERRYFSNLWKEQIEIYGSEINYFVNKANLSTVDPLYGEDPTSGFLLPEKILVMHVLNNDAIMLSKFGIMADADLSGVIHPIHFKAVFGDKEPKATDLMELTEFGADRLGFPKRGATVYELTEVKDEYEINPLGSHCVWFFKCRRYNYSQEPGSPGAGVGNNPNDDNDSLEAEGEKNFDYPSDNPCSNTGVYGEY